MHELEIVSHPLCPHAQRLVLLTLIAGKKLGSDIKISYLAYATLQQTVRLHSPTGELPVLKLKERPVSTCASAIAEYIHSAFGADLLPDEPLQRLLVRGAEHLTSTVLATMRGVFTARDPAGLESAFAELDAAAGAIEAHLTPEETPGALTHLGYVALAPLASLTGAFVALKDHALWDATPRLKAFLDAYRSNDLVSRSRCLNYEQEFDAFFVMTGSNFRSLINA